MPTPTTTTDPALTALRAEAQRRMGPRGTKTVMPATLTLPPGRRVYAQIHTRREPAARYIVKAGGWTPGSLLRWDTLWLDALPGWPEEQSPEWPTGYLPRLGETAFASGSTDFERVA